MLVHFQPPEEFIKEVIGSVHGKSNKLYDHIQTIERGMAEAANILTNKKVGLGFGNPLE
jgi:hypothetical protein